MIEIKWYARGGQGGFTASRLLALAAVRYGGFYAQAFPSFGPERRGAPVYAFTRIDQRPIRDHSQVYRCDHAIVLDGTLLETLDVSSGLKEGGTLFLNTPRGAEDFRFPSGVVPVCFDATALALETLGAPMANTAMAALCAAHTGICDLDALIRAIDEGMPPHLAEKNILLVKKAYLQALETADARAPGSA